MPRRYHPHFMESIEGPQVLLAVAPDRRTDGQTGHFWETTIGERRRQIDLQEENAKRTIVYFGVASSVRPPVRPSVCSRSHSRLGSFLRSTAFALFGFAHRNITLFLHCHTASLSPFEISCK